MNPMKKKRFLALTLSVTALFSCSLTPNAYASQIKQGQLVMKLSRTSLISGSDFFDGLGVSLTSSGVDVSADKATTYSISKNGKNYQAGEILTEVGTYQASASYGEDTVSLSFQVTAGNPVTASEGVGYRTLSAESVEKYRVGNFNYIGALGNGKTPSTGHSKLLVIPVGFADTAAFTSEELYKIQQAYFGAANTTGWQSLASFYETSSYGQLHFEGQLVKPFTYSMDSLSFENAYNASSAALAALIDKAVSYAYQQGVSPKDFDDNGDGFIDGLEIVYKTTRPNYRETKEDTSKIWWCFTTTLGTTASVDSPKANRFFWSLYSFIENGYYSPDIDTHTLVHESGHMLGLNDYYSYDREGLSPYEYPLGGADMMDMNVGDHNAYSKFLLGWVRPKYIDGSASDFTLTLNSFAESGDCLILKDTKSDPWNLTPYDEYLMLQYYTPTSLNAADSNGYAEWLSEEYKGKTGHAGTYAQPGLAVYHVDNRVVNFNGSTYSVATQKLTSEKWNYSDDISNARATVDSRSYEVLTSPSYQISSNTPSQSRSIVDHKLVANSPNREIEILPGDGIDHFGSHETRNLDYFGAQSNLFGLSQYGAGSSGYSNFLEKDLFTNGTTFNDASRLNYSFSVVAQTATSITLHFVENQ